jgi:hypothetical protein
MAIAAWDLFHEAVKVTLEKENWVITDDPLKVEVGGVKFEIDLGAERLLAAERAGIAVAMRSLAEASQEADPDSAFVRFVSSAS